MLKLSVFKKIKENKVPLYEGHLDNGKSIKSKLTWPLVDHPETRPWTWWWWHGSAVTKADNYSQPRSPYIAVVLGGVNIVCLQDVRDARYSETQLSFERMDGNGCLCCSRSTSFGDGSRHFASSRLGHWEGHRFPLTMLVPLLMSGVYLLPIAKRMACE